MSPMLGRASTTPAPATPWTRTAPAPRFAVRTGARSGVRWTGSPRRTSVPPADRPRSLLLEVLRAVDAGGVPERLTFALPPAQRHGWVGPCGTTLTVEGRRQLTRLTNQHQGEAHA